MRAGRIGILPTSFVTLQAQSTAVGSPQELSAVLLALGRRPPAHRSTCSRAERPPYDAGIERHFHRRPRLASVRESLSCDAGARPCTWCSAGLRSRSQLLPGNRVDQVVLLVVMRALECSTSLCGRFQCSALQKTPSHCRLSCTFSPVLHTFSCKRATGFVTKSCLSSRAAFSLHLHFPGCIFPNVCLDSSISSSARLARPSAPQPLMPRLRQ